MDAAVGRLPSPDSAKTDRIKGPQSGNNRSYPSGVGFSPASFRHLSSRASSGQKRVKRWGAGKAFKNSWRRGRVASESADFHADSKHAHADSVSLLDTGAAAWARGSGERGLTIALHFC